MSRRSAPRWLLLPALLGLLSLGRGLFLMRGDSADAFLPAKALFDAKPVQAGSGTWTSDAPTASKKAAEAPCKNCDVVVITLCSLRRDHLGPYGASPSPSPHLDQMMNGAFLMKNAWSASNFTLAGLTAVLTGRFGSSTGVTGWDKGLTKDVPTLPEILGYYGYQTGAFTIDAPSGFRPDYGLNRGFQQMKIIPPPRDTPDGRQIGGDIGPGGASAQPAAEWLLSQDKNTPVFLMFHSRTAHYPFVLSDDPSDTTGVTTLLWQSGGAQAGARAMPGTAGGTAQRGVVTIAGPDPVQEGVLRAGEAGLQVWKRRYWESVQRMDLDLAVIEKAIAARGRPTVLLILADHGESLGDHGELLHGDAYFDGVVHIPMLLKVAGMEGHSVDALASQVDVLPTLLELVGATVPAGIDGFSLLPVLRGEKTEIRQATLVEGGVSWHDDGFLRGAVVAPPWILLRQDRGCGEAGEGPRLPGEPANCLFDLVHDPDQHKNMATEKAEVTKDLLERWEAFRAARGIVGKQLQLDPAYVQQLQKTGYDFRPQ